MAGAQGMKELALAWLVLDLTGSLAQLGIVVFMQGFPQSAMALFGGVLADRYLPLLNLFAACLRPCCGD